MTARVIQGSFVVGGPRLPSSVAQPPRLPGPPVPTFAGRPPVAQPRLPGPPAPAFVARPPVVQRHGSGAAAVEAGQIGLAAGGGRPLPDAVRGKMEAALGADFSNVRVHVGAQAERIGAIAFTVGSDIYFAPGRFQPDTAHGQQLLGHELAHVVQQRAGRVRNPLGSGLAVVQDHALEAEADRLGRQAAAHRMAIQATPEPVRAQATIQQARRGWRLLSDDEFADRTGLTLDWRGGVSHPAAVKLRPTELARARAVTQVVKLDPTELARREFKLSPEAYLDEWRAKQTDFITKNFGPTKNIQNLNPNDQKKLKAEFLNKNPRPKPPAQPGGKLGAGKEQNRSPKPSPTLGPRSLDFLPGGLVATRPALLNSPPPTQPQNVPLSENDRIRNSLKSAPADSLWLFVPTFGKDKNRHGQRTTTAGTRWFAVRWGDPNYELHIHVTGNGGTFPKTDDKIRPINNPMLNDISLPEDTLNGKWKKIRAINPY